MKTKSKHSLYRGDYYTIEEYEELMKFLGSSLISFFIKNYLRNGVSAVKRHIHRNPIYKDVSGVNLYDLIYNTPLDNVPLFLNEDSHMYFRMSMEIAN